MRDALVERVSTDEVYTFCLRIIQHQSNHAHVTAGLDHKKITFIIVVLIVGYVGMSCIKESPCSNFRQMLFQELIWIHDGINMVTMPLIAFRLLPSLFLVEFIEVPINNLF